MIKKILVASIVGVSLFACKNKEVKTSAISKEQMDVVFDKEVKHLNNAYPRVEKEGLLPRSIYKGYRPIADWTSGFYPGNLWMAYEYTNDASLLPKAILATELLEDEKYNTKDHDIGFRIYCSYGRAYDATQNPKYKEVIIQAAESAIQRFDPKVGVIMSWNPWGDGFKGRGWQYPVIIDNMMNLELLFAASKFTGDKKYYNVAVKHADKTMKYQYREDISCSHVVDYDSITGAFRNRDFNNGYWDASVAAWSRGQSWGLYGYTVMYRETKDVKYLQHAEKIAAFLLNHPNMPEDMIPYWDYHAPELPSLRDASAGALLASALLELKNYSKENSEIYFNAAEKILTSLSSSEYMAEPGTNENFLIKHATGNFRMKSELDGPLIYADYYFLEALLRYKEAKNI